jgi:hypothetical protein
MGELECCHDECSAGCLSPANPSACRYCQHFEDLVGHFNGRCEGENDLCPVNTIEWSVVSLCISSCTGLDILYSIDCFGHHLIYVCSSFGRDKSRVQ